MPWSQQSVYYSNQSSVYVQDTAPTQPPPIAPNSIWFDTANNSINTWTGTAWEQQTFNAQQLIQVGTILGNLIASNAGITGSQLASNAGITAGQVSFTAAEIGGVSIYVQATQPTGQNSGDLWYDTSSGNQLYEYNGSSWTAYQYGTNAIADNAITTALINSGAVTATQIADGTITATQIASDAAILGTQLADGTVTATQIESGTITNAQIAAAAGILGTQIAQATITSGNIAANTIVAGNVDAADIISGVIDGATITGNTISGATFEGTDWLENANGEFFYSSTPASGNLTASVVPGTANVTDPEGNTAYPGVTVYGSIPSGGTEPANVQVHVNSTIDAPAIELPTNLGSETKDAALYVIPESPGTSTEYAALFIEGPESSGNANNVDIVMESAAKNGSTSPAGLLRYSAGSPSNIVAGWGPSGFTIYNALTATGGTKTVPTLITTDSWHDLTLATDWANYGGSYAPMRYRLLPDGNLQIDGLVEYSGSSTGAITLGTLPSGYIPTYTAVFPFPSAGSESRWPYQISNNGAVEGLGIAASGNLVEIHCIIPLD